MKSKLLGRYLNKFGFFLAIIFGLIFIVGYEFSFGQSREVQASSSTFFCGSERYNRILMPTTFVNPAVGGRPVALIYWVPDYFRSPSPEERCSIATNKLQAYSDNGLLRYISTDIVNDLPVICITRSVGSRCSESDVVITLRPGTDRTRALGTLLNLNRRVNGQPLRITGDIVVYQDGEAYLNYTVFVEILRNQ